MKTCRKCSALFEGRYCKACAIARASKWYADNPEKAKSSRAKWHTANIAKVRTAASEWRTANPEKVKASRAREKIANPDGTRIAAAKHYAKHPEKVNVANKKWRDANKNKVKLMSAQWAAEHPEARRISGQNRRAKKRANGGVLSKGLATKLFALQKGKCPCCGKPLGGNYHLDHKMPIALGGKNEDWNMQLLRQRCNQQKHVKDPINFMQSRGFLL